MFDSVTAILFLASASEFDQVLLEDGETNRVREALHIFESLVNFPGFADISFILFLNKMDLLEEKVRLNLLIYIKVRTKNIHPQVLKRKADIRDHFGEEWADTTEVRRHVDKFGGDHTSLADVKAFVLYLFASKVRQGPDNAGINAGSRGSRRSSKRQLYHHFTTAVDTRYVKRYHYLN